MLKSNVALYGGFRGTESRRAERDPTANVTILSGDILRNDLPRWANRMDNAENVLTGTNVVNARLDGFTVRGGHSGRHLAKGAGINLTQSDLAMTDCRVIDNFSRHGAGICTSGGKQTLLRCDVSNNHIALGRGGGLYIASTSISLTDCTVSGNLSHASSTIGHGAGVFVASTTATVVFTRCLIQGNNTRLRSTRYYPRGGGLYSQGNVTMNACRVLSNDSGVGGGIYVHSGTIVIHNSVVANNKATRFFNLGGFAGGIGVHFYAKAATITNSVIYGNSAPEDGGGVSGPATLIDCIVWANRDRNRQMTSRSQVRGTKQSYCCIMNYLYHSRGEKPIDPRDFPGCTLKNPQLVNAATGDYRILPTSPCIDTGDPKRSARGLDLYGNPRRLDGKLDGTLRGDMGAHEFSSVRLAGTVTPLATGSRVSLSVSGKTALPAVLVAGVPGPGLVIAPFGELFVSLTEPVLPVPLGAIPSKLTITLPPAGVDVMVQALALSGLAANLSNPLRLALP